MAANSKTKSKSQKEAKKGRVKVGKLRQKSVSLMSGNMRQIRGGLSKGIKDTIVPKSPEPKDPVPKDTPKK